MLVDACFYFAFGFSYIGFAIVNTREFVDTRYHAILLLESVDGANPPDSLLVDYRGTEVSFS